MSNVPAPPQPGDLDDFVVECDEHLTAARAHLLRVEAARDFGAAGREFLDGLFRAFHTVKGLAGMVGARTVEEGAHVLESYLGGIRREESPLTEAGIDLLLEGIGILETAVAAFRSGEPPPDASHLANRVSGLIASQAASSASSSEPKDSGESMTFGALPVEKQTRLAAAMQRNERVLLLTFTPTPELAGRGVNINVVRDRIQAVAEILHAEPIAAPGGIQFCFVVIVPPGVRVDDWVDDGIAATPYQSKTGPHESAFPSKPHSGIAPANLVRVDLDRLDDLMRMVGELVLSRARLESGLARLAGYVPARHRRELEETAQTIERQLRDLREGVMRVRLIPVRDLFARMRLVVRDLTRETEKDVELVVVGGETEIDKYVVERMADPLLHMVRNAISHGLESVDERKAAGKPTRGRLWLRAATAGGMIVLEIEDDGRGIQPESVFARALDAGLIAPGTSPDPASLLDLLCTPGFSTRDLADRSSGRGVGMDVVRLAIEGLGGTLAMDSRPGVGTRFMARLPLTLVVADVLTIAVGSQTFAIPQAAVREVLAVEPEMTIHMENNELVRYRGGVLPLLRLSDVFGVPRGEGMFVALVTGEGAAKVGLGADRALGLREVVVRPLADPLVQVPGLGGATELGDGRPILILDPGGLARLARRRSLAPSTRIRE